MPRPPLSEAGYHAALFVLPFVCLFVFLFNAYKLGRINKKWIIRILLLVVIVALCLFVWFYGYYNRKSNDNLPTLTAIAEMGESKVNSLLPGYHINQLKEVWGEPDSSEGCTDHWTIGDVTLIVNYKNNGIVAICGLKDANGASLGE